MAPLRWAAVICGVFWCSRTSAADSDLAAFSAILSRAKIPASSFQGQFISYSGECDVDSPLDFQTAGLEEQSRGRVRVQADNVLVEFLADNDLTAVGPESEFNDVQEVLAKSGTRYFHFAVVGTTLTPYANLRIHDAETSAPVASRLHEHVMVYLTAITEIGGLSVESVLISPDAVVQVDPASGRYSIEATTTDPANPVSFQFSLVVAGSNVTCTGTFAAGTASQRLVVESRVDAEVRGKAIVPRRVARRFSGSGYGTPRREVMRFSPSQLDEIVFPVSTEFFKRYQRNLSILHGDSVKPTEYVDIVPEHLMQPLHQRMNPSRGQIPQPGTERRTVWLVTILIVTVAVLAARLRRNWRRK